MLRVIGQSWALFLGLLLLMIGNALQGSLLGVRAVIEDFSTETYGFVSAGYFAGFLGGSYATPWLLRRVGHVRVFAALASLISAAFIAYAAIIDPVFWFLMRFAVGFGFSGVYIVAESWLNDASTNETRGQTLSAYMFVQFAGVVMGQQLLNAGDPATYDLFILLTVMVSLSFTPILLSVAPAPIYQVARRMSFADLFRASPLGSAGNLMLGGVFGAMFGMSSVYATRIGFSIVEISILLSALYFGAVLFVVPIGWLSDHMDRRVLIVIVALGGGLSSVLAVFLEGVVLAEVGGFNVYALYAIALLVGGLANPLYSLLLAHTNDFLETDQMASASGGLVFLNGVGALMGPITVGYAMTAFGDAAFWGFQAALLLAMASYGLWRMTQRPTVDSDDTGPYTVLGPRMTAVAVEIAQEVALEQAEAAEEAAEAAKARRRAARIEAERLADRAEAGEGDEEDEDMVGPIDPDVARRAWRTRDRD